MLGPAQDQQGETMKITYPGAVRLIFGTTWFLFSALALAPAANAKVGATVQEPVKEFKQHITNAQPNGTYPAPGRRATLIYSSTSSEGDFPEATVLIKQGRHYYDLGAYRSIRLVKWAKDGRSVSFEGNKLVSFGLDDVSLVTFVLGQPTLQRKVLRQVKEEPSG
jgi:hypothetical protein